jgi:hypothetical protein
VLWLIARVSPFGASISTEILCRAAATCGQSWRHSSVRNWGRRVRTPTPGVKPEEPLVCLGKDCIVTFDDPAHPELGSDGEYHIREGDRGDLIVNPANKSITITHIDLVKDGFLWEEKTAVNEIDNIPDWIGKIDKKMCKYIELRQYLHGRKQAPIGLVFNNPR